MHLEEFAHGESLIHRLDPRVKIVVSVLFSAAAAPASDLEVAAGALAVSLTLILLARLSWAKLLKRLAVINLFVLMLWLFLPFSTDGTPVFSLGPLSATWEGLGLALLITVKSNAIILAFIALWGTASFAVLVHALTHLKVPDKLVVLFYFTFRYFQVIHQEYLRLRAAMKVRCFTPKTNLHTYRSLAYLVGMMVVRSLERAERVHQAMLCRGFKGKFWLLHHFVLRPADLAFLGVMIAVSGVLAVGPYRGFLF